MHQDQVSGVKCLDVWFWSCPFLYSSEQVKEAMPVEEESKWVRPEASEERLEVITGYTSKWPKMGTGIDCPAAIVYQVIIL